MQGTRGVQCCENYTTTHFATETIDKNEKNEEKMKKMKKCEKKIFFKKNQKMKK